MEDFVSCVRIAVYCVKNDPVNIKNGEPSYLGFNFIVKKDEANEILMLIRAMLDNLEIPYDDVDVFGSIELPITKVWSKEGISRAIKNGREFLINENEKRTKKK